MNKVTEDNRPVLIVTDKEGYLVQAGAPDAITGKQALKYIHAGYTSKTITLKEYRETNYTWIYDKPKK